MIDAVLSYHDKPATCGVTKFNQQLAAHLGVPHASIVSWFEHAHPLVSIKPSEISVAWLKAWSWRQPYSLFLHEAPISDGLLPLLKQAATVYAANRLIADRLRPFRADVIAAWCPSTVQGNPTRGAINVLTFGMAHKLQLPYYERLKALLDATGQPYTVSLSTAVHEGSPWDAVASAGSQLRTIFGDHLRELGFLADDALAKELRDCAAVALFFDPAARENNTSFWAAVDARRPLITTLDGHSPWPHGVTSLHDIRTLRCWPSAWDFDSTAGWPNYSWDELRQLLGAHVAV